MSATASPTCSAAEQQKCLAKTPEREDGGYPDKPPECDVQAAQLGPLDRERTPFRRTWRVRFLHRVKNNADGKNRGDHGDPEHQPEVVVAGCHEQHREQRANERTHGVHRLAQAERSSAELNGCHVADQSVAGCTPNALANPINKAGNEHDADTGCERKQGLCQRPHAISEQNERFSFANPIADRTREDPCDRCGCLGNPFDDANREGAHTKDRDQERREQAVDDL